MGWGRTKKSGGRNKQGVGRRIGGVGVIVNYELWISKLLLKNNKEKLKHNKQ